MSAAEAKHQDSPVSLFKAEPSATLGPATSWEGLLTAAKDWNTLTEQLRYVEPASGARDRDLGSSARLYTGFEATLRQVLDGA